jgi:hypothetical protein
MSFLRSIVSDLVERRLWPIALALVAALVAVPLVLAKSPANAGNDAPSAPPASAPTTPPAANADGAVVSVASGSLGDAPLGGRAKNPFRQQHVPHKAPVASGPVGSAPKPSGSGSSGPTSGGSGPAQRHGSGSSGGAAPSKPELYAIAHVNVRFGPAAGTLKAIDDVARLTPLPSAASPIAIFLGVRGDEQTAVFLISTDVHAQGDGECRPSRKDCEKVYLKQGQTEILDVMADNGAVTEYELDLVNVTVTHTTSKSKAQQARAHNSRTSRRLLKVAASARVAGTLSVRP